MGEGRNPGRDELVGLGLEAKLPRAGIEAIIERTGDALGRWPELAETHGVSRSNIGLVAARIGALSV